jgi:hypothetical protein
MTDFPQYRYHDKDAIKAQLPLTFACYQLGINLSHDARALCPFHADTDPSFYLWVGDDGVERWSCQPCGINGDVYSLITRVRGCSFGDAVAIAAEMVSLIGTSDYVPPVVHQPRQGPEQWGYEVAAAIERAALPEWRGKLSAWSELADPLDPEACYAMDEYLRTYLSWGCDEFGSALMPHFGPDGVLTGAKIRDPSGQRVSKEGSKYEHLYGAWRKPTRDVLLTEGETDMAWAAYTAHREGLANLTVYALPRGARASITGDQLKFLKPAHTVYLALDPDEAGIEATRAWVESLATQGHQNIRVCRLPLGKDLRDAQPNLGQLLANAQTPLAKPVMIEALPGGYVITTDKGDTKSITNWTVDPIATLTGGEDGPGYQLRLRHRGQIHEEVIRHSDLASVSRLRAWCADRGLYFTCTDRYVGLVAEHLEWRASLVPEVFQTSRVGLHRPPSRYGFATPSVVYPGGYTGTLPWLYAPGPKKANVTGQVLLPGDGGPIQWSWLEAFVALSDPSVTHTLISWVCAAARRPEVRDFPILFIGGPSGSGKSTLAKLALKMSGSAIESPLGGITPYILMQRLSSTTSLQIFVDEWTRMSRKDTREAMQGMMPMIYEGGISERGTSDLSTVRYQMTSPVIMAGEDTLHMDREIDRVITVQPRRSWQSFEALDHVAAAPLERIGNLLHWFVSSSGVSLPPLAPVQSPTRVQHNREVLRGGWRTLLAMLEYASDMGDDVPQLPEEPALPTEVEGMGEDDRENVYEAAVKGGSVLRDTSQNPLAWPDVEGRGTWVRFEALMKVVGSNLDLDLPGGSRAAVQYFKGQHRVVKGRSRPPESMKEFRAYLIHEFHLNQD